MTQDQRNSPRARCYLGARLVMNDGKSTLGCTMRNHSDGGALLEFTDAPAVPREITVVVDNFGVLTPSEIVWRQGRKLGVAFCAQGGLNGMKAAAAARGTALRDDARIRCLRSATGY